MRNRNHIATSAFALVLVVLFAWSATATAQQKTEDVRASEASTGLVMQMMTLTETFGLPAELQEALVEASVEKTGGDAAADRTSKPSDSETADLVGATAGDSRAELEAEALEALDNRRSDDDQSDSPRETSDSEASASGASEKARAASSFEEVAYGGRDGSEAQTESTIGMSESVADTPGEKPSADVPVDLGAKDDRSVREVIDLYRDAIASCYRERLAQRPSLAGRVTLEFAIGKDGNVVSTRIERSTLNDQKTEACMMQTVRGIDFPSPSSGQKTTWNIPFFLGAK